MYAPHITPEQIEHHDALLADFAAATTVAQFNSAYGLVEQAINTCDRNCRMAERARLIKEARRIRADLQPMVKAEYAAIKVPKIVMPPLGALPTIDTVTDKVCADILGTIEFGRDVDAQLVGAVRQALEEPVSAQAAE